MVECCSLLCNWFLQQACTHYRKYTHSNRSTLVQLSCGASLIFRNVFWAKMICFHQHPQLHHFFLCSFYWLKPVELRRASSHQFKKISIYTRNQPNNLVLNLDTNLFRLGYQISDAKVTQWSKTINSSALILPLYPNPCINQLGSLEL